MSERTGNLILTGFAAFTVAVLAGGFLYLTGVLL